MSALAEIFFTYLWHYLLARLIYDDLVRPVAHGRVGVLVWTVPALGLGTLLWRASLGRRRR